MQILLIKGHVVFGCDGISAQAVDDVLALLVSPSPLPKLQEPPGLNVEEARLDRCGATLATVSIAMKKVLEAFG